jgi:hypothetical protein
VLEQHGALVDALVAGLIHGVALPLAVWPERSRMPDPPEWIDRMESGLKAEARGVCEASADRDGGR